MAGGMTYEEYLARYGTLTYSNVGTSMLPLLREGRDLFMVEPKGDARCSVGDVALYRRPPSHYVLHRVVGVVPDGYLMLGDNCISREHVPEGDVIGVMSGFVRNGRQHGVECAGYRAYVWIWLHTERARVSFKRAALSLRARAKRLRHGR